MNVKKSFFVAVLIALICLFATGCFKGSSEVSVQEDGSVIVHNKIVGVDFIGDEIEKIKNDTEKHNSSAKITKITDGNMSGYEIEMKYTSMTDFAKNSGKITGAHEGKCKGIQEHKGWFFDAYSVDLLQEGNKNEPPSMSGEMDSMVQAMLAQIKFDFTWNLPYAADKNNADTVSNENKMLYWNLAPTLAKGEDKQIQMEFKIWHKEHIAITAIFALFLCLLLFFLLWKSMSNNDPDQKKRMTVGAALVACILLCVGGVSAYMILSPVKFTDSEIISEKYSVKEPEESKKSSEPQKETKLKNEEKRIETPKDTASSSLSAVQDVLKKHGIQDDVEATSYGHSMDGSLSLTRAKGGKRMFLIDEKNHQVAFVEYTPDVYGFVNNRGKAYIPPVIFKVSILNDVRDADKDLGIWNGDDHVFEIYAAYDFDGEGKVVPGMLTSGSGAKPSHYQAYLKEQKNVDLANLFLTEMQSLHSDVNRRGL